MVALGRRSLLVLVLLFGLFFAVAIAALEALQGPGWLAPLLAACFVGLQYLMGPSILQIIFRIRWVPLDELGPEISEFVRESCQKLKVAVPRVGIIEDGNPNAFTFGHHAGNARLVVTSGLLQMLEAEEAKAVIGHELGHVKNRDFIVMTIAAAVPIMLYAIYRITFRGRGGRGRGGAYLLLVGIASYIAYILSHYIVLLLSRIREYYADERSAFLTGNPNALSRALVKVAYGLARGHEAEKEERAPRVELTRALGIFDVRAARALALATAQVGGDLNPRTVVEAMRWDLWNPWATLWELSSTHPLPAKRIRRLGRLAVAFSQPPEYPLFEQPPESFYDEFAADLFFASLPFICAVLGAGVGYLLHTAVGGGVALPVGLGLLGLGAGWLRRLSFSYPRGFGQTTVESLVTRIKVSGVRAVPCVLRGRVIGRGLPGLYWSEDLVLGDETGFVVLDYRQPWGVWEFLFGLLAAERFIGKEVVACGWYRRDPRPRVEISHLVDTGTGKVLRCHYRHLLYFTAGLLTASGLAVIFLGFMLF